MNIVLIALYSYHLYIIKSCGLMDKAPVDLESGDCRFESNHDQNTFMMISTKNHISRHGN